MLATAIFYSIIELDRNWLSLFIDLQMYWDKMDHTAWFGRSLELICGLYNLDSSTTSDIVHKLICTGFINKVLYVKVKFRLVPVVSCKSLRNLLYLKQCIIKPKYTCSTISVAW